MSIACLNWLVNKRVLLMLGLGVLSALNVRAQSFTNLDFESANVPSVPTNQPGAPVSISLGMPGWSAYLNSPSIGQLTQLSQITHNDISAGGAVVAIEGAQWPSTQILQGNYSAYITGSGFGTPTSAYIAQTGQIPVSAESLMFWASPNANFQVTVGGQSISLVQFGSTANYNIFGGDISAYAGLTRELRFTALPNIPGGFLDNIQFSVTPVPEPGTCALLFCGAILFGAKRWRKA